MDSMDLSIRGLRRQNLDYSSGTGKSSPHPGPGDGFSIIVDLTAGLTAQLGYQARMGFRTDSLSESSCLVCALEITFP